MFYWDVPSTFIFCKDLLQFHIQGRTLALTRLFVLLAHIFIRFSVMPIIGELCLFLKRHIPRNLHNIHHKPTGPAANIRRPKLATLRKSATIYFSCRHLASHKE